MMSKFTGKIKNYGEELTKNKRGSIQDVIFGGSYLLKVSITIVICVFIWIAFQSLMTRAVSGHSSESIITSVMATLTSAYFSMDYLFPFIVGGLLLISTIFAYKTGSNILLGIISFIFWIIAIVLAALFVNVYIAVSAEFPTIYTSFPIMDIIMTNLHFFTLGWLAIITLVMFRKNNKEDVSAPLQQSFYG